MNPIWDYSSRTIKVNPGQRTHVYHEDDLHIYLQRLDDYGAEDRTLADIIYDIKSAETVNCRRWLKTETAEYLRKSSNTLHPKTASHYASMIRRAGTFDIRLDEHTLFKYHTYNDDTVPTHTASLRMRMIEFNKDQPYAQDFEIKFEWQNQHREIPFTQMH